MYCQHCGKQIKDGVRFCTFCGLPQELEDAEAVHQEEGNDAPAVTQRIERLSSNTPSSECRVKRRTWVIPVAVLSVIVLTGVLVAGASYFGLLDGFPAVQLPEAPRGLPLISELVGGQSEDVTASQGVSGTTSTDGQEVVGESGDPNPSTDVGQVASPSQASESSIAEGTTEVRGGLNEYSWSELKSIAVEIESCSSSDASLEVAGRYNLVDSSGKLKAETKDVSLSDGKTMHMRLIGVWHDKANTPSGKAGLTFLSDGMIERRSMHSHETIAGGWQSSDMRVWLSSNLWGSLPDEVTSAIISAYKLTNNSGETRSVSSVTETEDALWLPSIVELCGPVNWEYQSNPSNSGLYNSIFNAEGSQYLAFSQQSIDSFADNNALSLGGEWWMRSTSPASGKGRFVSSDGDPSFYDTADKEKGVVVGFCL